MERGQGDPAAGSHAPIQSDQRSTVRDVQHQSRGRASLRGCRGASITIARSAHARRSTRRHRDRSQRGKSGLPARAPRAEEDVRRAGASGHVPGERRAALVRARASPRRPRRRRGLGSLGPDGGVPSSTPDGGGVASSRGGAPRRGRGHPTRRTSTARGVAGGAGGSVARGFRGRDGARVGDQRGGFGGRGDEGRGGRSSISQSHPRSSRAGSESALRVLHRGARGGGEGGKSGGEIQRGGERSLREQHSHRVDGDAGAGSLRRGRGASPNGRVD